MHRDIKPANILLQSVRRAAPNPAAEAKGMRNGDVTLIAPDERALSGDLGIAKDPSRSGSATTVLGGTAAVSLSGAKRVRGGNDPAADIYAATASLWRRSPRSNRRSSHAVVAGSGPVLPSVWRKFFSAGMALDPKSRFPSVSRGVQRFMTCCTRTPLHPGPSRYLGTSRHQGLPRNKGLAS